MTWIKQLKEILAYIELNLDKRIDYKEISNIFGRSISETQHIFTFVVGITLGDYIRKRRLSEAYNDIIKTDNKIIDIALKYQYESHSSFSRAFVQTFLVSPIEVRNKKIQITTYDKQELDHYNNMNRRNEDDTKVRIVRIPNCKMVVSEVGMFGDGKLELFDDWFSKFPEPMFPKDFLTYDNERNGFIWLYMYDESMKIPNNFRIIDFTGGLYLVSTGIDGEDDLIPKRIMHEYLKASTEFEYDHSRLQLGNVTTPKSAQQILGYSLMDYYMPIKIKENSNGE